MPDKWELATKKLFELTEAGMLTWTLSDESIADGPVLGFVYRAVVNDKTIFVYEEKIKRRLEDGIPDGRCSVIEFAVWDAGRDRWVPQWRWPGNSYDDVLLDSVRFHTAGSEEFLETFLSSAAT